MDVGTRSRSFGVSPEGRAGVVARSGTETVGVERGGGSNDGLVSAASPTSETIGGKGVAISSAAGGDGVGRGGAGGAGGVPTAGIWKTSPGKMRFGSSTTSAFAAMT